MDQELISKVEMTARHARHELAELMPLLKETDVSPELRQLIASAVYEIGLIIEKTSALSAGSK